MKTNTDGFPAAVRRASRAWRLLFAATLLALAPALTRAADPAGPSVPPRPAPASSASMDALDDRQKLTIGDRISFRILEDKDDPTQVTWRREVGAFSDHGFLRGPGFESLFGNLFDQLVFEFDQPVDVEGWIDRLEDNPQRGVKLQIESDGSACEITLAGYPGRMRIGRTALTVRGRGRDSAGLLDQFLAFLRDFGTLGERLKLKG